MHEKRKLTRLKLLYHLRVFDKRSFIMLGYLADIHTEGMMIVSERPQKIHRNYDVKIALPEAIYGQDEIRFTAEALWTTPYVNPLFHQTGFRIQSIEKARVQLLESMILNYGFQGVFENNAVKLYRGVEGYNCAQAILKVFQDRLNVPDKQIIDYAAYGGGNADDGICGALYAIMQLAGDTDLVKMVTQQFKEEVGSIHCDEILEMGRLSCAGFICSASQILQRILDDA